MDAVQAMPCETFRDTVTEQLKKTCMDDLSSVLLINI